MKIILSLPQFYLILLIVLGLSAWALWPRREEVSQREQVVTSRVDTGSWIWEHSAIPDIDTISVKWQIIYKEIALSNFREGAKNRMLHAYDLANSGNYSAAIKIQKWYNSFAVPYGNRMVDTINQMCESINWKH